VAGFGGVGTTSGRSRGREGGREGGKEGGRVVGDTYEDCRLSVMPVG